MTLFPYREQEVDANFKKSVI